MCLVIGKQKPTVCYSSVSNDSLHGKFWRRACVFAEAVSDFVIFFAKIFESYGEQYFLDFARFRVWCIHSVFFIFYFFDFFVTVWFA